MSTFKTFKAPVEVVEVGGDAVLVQKDGLKYVGIRSVPAMEEIAQAINEYWPLKEMVSRYLANERDKEMELNTLTQKNTELKYLKDLAVQDSLRLQGINEKLIAVLEKFASLGVPSFPELEEEIQEAYTLLYNIQSDKKGE